MNNTNLEENDLADDAIVNNDYGIMGGMTHTRGLIKKVAKKQGLTMLDLATALKTTRQNFYYYLDFPQNLIKHINTLSSMLEIDSDKLRQAIIKDIFKK